METEKGLILRQGHAAGCLGDAAGPVVVEGKDGREEAADPGMNEVMEKVAAAARHRNRRESAHVRVMGAEPLDKGIYGRMEVIRQRVGMDNLRGHRERFLDSVSKHHDKEIQKSGIRNEGRSVAGRNGLSRPQTTLFDDF